MVLNLKERFTMCQHKKITVCLALIHNNNTQRNASIKPCLEELRIKLSHRFFVRTLTISMQPEIRSHGKSIALLRDAISQALDREWCRYRLFRPQHLPLQALHFLVNSFKKLRSDSNWMRNSFVETVVTDKHIRAWASFLETDGDFLICFEDDAIFNDNSLQKVNELLYTLSKKCLDSCSVYVDMAGGCTLEELKIDALQIDKDDSYRFYNKPVTNTACTYLMSRSLVTAFYEIITRRPWLRLIGVDWMINKLFILLAKDGVPCFCMHADPSIFKHGTKTGEYVSWQVNVSN